MPPSKTTKIITVSVFLLSSLFFAANLVVGSWFVGRAWPGTVLAGQNLTGQNIRQIEKIGADLAESEPTVQLSINDQNFSVAPAAIGSVPDTARMAALATKLPTNSWLPVLALRQHSQQVTAIFRPDADKLQKVLASITAKVNLPPTDASIGFTNGQVVVTPGKPGIGVTVAAAKSVITAALAVGSHSVAISTSSIDSPVTPATLEPLAQQWKQLMALPIQLTYQGKSFTPDKATIGSWIGETATAAGPTLAPKADQINAYLSKLGKGVNVAAKNQIIDTVNGAVRSTTPGANGLAIDQPVVVASISAALTASRPLKLELPTQVVAFKTVYNQTYNLDSPKYVEVNLSSQHMWVYQGHQVVMDTPITSGSAGTGHPTVQGLFAVYTKERDRWLDGRPLGYNYNVFVQYWMPFYKDYGLHDASWRHSFGGPDYYYGGSHGCVNMPIPAAAWLYNWIDVGTPVWVHS